MPALFICHNICHLLSHYLGNIHHIIYHNICAILAPNSEHAYFVKLAYIMFCNICENMSDHLIKFSTHVPPHMSRPPPSESSEESYLNLNSGRPFV